MHQACVQLLFKKTVPVLCRPETKGERVVQEHVFYRYFLSVSGAPNPAGVFGAPRKNIKGLKMKFSHNVAKV